MDFITRYLKTLCFYRPIIIHSEAYNKFVGRLQKGGINIICCYDLISTRLIPEPALFVAENKKNYQELTLEGRKVVFYDTKVQTEKETKEGENDLQEQLYIKPSRYQNFTPSYIVERILETEPLYFEQVYRRLAKLPWDIGVTEHCLIRETTEADVDEFYKIYAEPSISKYMEMLYPDREQELQYARDYRDMIYSLYGFGMWTITDKKTGEVIGRAGLSMREDFEEPELGFLIAKPYQQNGLALEVCCKILQIARTELEMKTVQALVQPENIASVKLCDRLGFHYADTVFVKGRHYNRYLIKL
ncbi:MAG: GNAT family N-acetyltransferase [Lachnospiraceae bacterium]|nr:GNAT family N-acetyltransferase [Lachnospiraceae bacterium]